MEQNSETHSLPSKSIQIDDLGLNKNIQIMSSSYTTDCHIKEELDNMDIKNIALSKIKCEPDWENLQTETNPHSTLIKVEPDISEMINDAEECEFMENLNEALDEEWKVENENFKLKFEDNEDSMESSHFYQYDNENCTTDENPETSNTNRYRCQICNFETRYKGNLKLHSFKHTGNAELDEFRCDQCPYKTVYKRNINRHLLKHTSLKDIIRYKCEHCSYMTIYKRSLSLHLNHKHKDLEGISKLKCNQCNYKTTFQKKLDSHVLKHADPEEVNMFQCDRCDFKTLYKRNLKSHLLKHRNPLEGCRFQCEQCDFQTNYKSNLNKHVQKHQEVAVVQGCQKDLKLEPQ